MQHCLTDVKKVHFVVYIHISKFYSLYVS